MKRMPLFDFELMPVEDIKPWGEAGKKSLGWYALTDGFFRIPVGDQVLFRYSDERMSHWRDQPRDVNYMIAAFARDVLGSVGPGAAPLPERIERLASDWDLLERLRTESEAGAGDDAAEELYYTAWRWLGARSPGTWYLNPHPNIYFVRIGDDVHIHWDSEFLVDGEPAWAARRGVHVLPVATFVAEGRDFANRLLAAMEERIAGIEAGTLRPQIEVNVPSLRQQHETWRTELESYFGEYEPDMPWDETETALRTLAEKSGVQF